MISARSGGVAFPAMRTWDLTDPLNFQSSGKLWSRRRSRTVSCRLFQWKGPVDGPPLADKVHDGLSFASFSRNDQSARPVAKHLVTTPFGGQPLIVAAFGNRREQIARPGSQWEYVRSWIRKFANGIPSAHGSVYVRGGRRYEVLAIAARHNERSPPMLRDPVVRGVENDVMKVVLGAKISVYSLKACSKNSHGTVVGAHESDDVLYKEHLRLKHPDEANGCTNGLGTIVFHAPSSQGEPLRCWRTVGMVGPPQGCRPRRALRPMSRDRSFRAAITASSGSSRFQDGQLNSRVARQSSLFST